MHPLRTNGAGRPTYAGESNDGDGGPTDRPAGPDPSWARGEGVGGCVEDGGGDGIGGWHGGEGGAAGAGHDRREIGLAAPAGTTDSRRDGDVGNCIDGKAGTASCWIWISL